MTTQVCHDCGFPISRSTLGRFPMTTQCGTCLHEEYGQGDQGDKDEPEEDNEAT